MDAGIKIFYVEEIDPYESRGVAGGYGFFDEEQANKLEAKLEQERGKIYSFFVQEIPVKFSHRNGETQEPTVEGFYFVKDNWLEERGLKIVFCNGVYTFKLWENPVKTLGIVAHDERERFSYYGPIPTPEEI